jgi:DNA (cytosine-5)-methyltransferase 1
MGGALTTRYAKGVNSTMDDGAIIYYAPDKAATLTAGISRKPGVNPPGRRQEDDYNIVCVTGAVTHTLTAEGADASEDGTGRGTPIVTGPNVVAFHENSRGELRTTDIAGCLSTGGGKPGQGYPAIAFDWQTAGSDRTRPNISAERTSTIQCTNRDAIMDEYGVRRLTPLECERLQGYPDEHTDGQSDAQRYRQMGNSVAIPVVEFIAHRLVQVDGSIGVLGQAA